MKRRKLLGPAQRAAARSGRNERGDEAVGPSKHDLAVDGTVGRNRGS